MKLKINKIICYTALLVCMFSFQKSVAQCFQIESILVDACGADEGLNEMVRFKVGTTAINTSNLSVNWPSNSWLGLIKNTTTAAKVAALNADILAAGGCGQLLEPTAGVLPANATVILITSYNLDTALNSFGALTETIYLIFQNNPSVTAGHFANFGFGTRTLTINFGSCSDTVTYNRALLINAAGENSAEDGATVLFTTAGVATYVNYGCSAPVDPFTVDAGPTSITACAGTTVSLTGTAIGQQSVLWSAASGSFSANANLVTNYTIPTTAGGQTIVLTLTATNSCGAVISDTINLIVTNSVTPAFSLPTSLCTGSTAPILPTTSNNGITGTWNPSTINTTTSGSYIFTPASGQCATSFTLNVTVSDSITPAFSIVNTVCTGSTAPILPITSNNGITGTWNPSTINTSTSGSYIFTPASGQCATSFTLNVTVSNSITPAFSIVNTICTGSTAPILPTTSNNGITGTWNPSTINTTTSGSYIFTPASGQCATSFTLNVTVSNSITPAFSIVNTICSGSTAPILPTTSNNGITGTWNPTTVNTTTSGSYIFTPNSGQCASEFSIEITVSNFEVEFVQNCKMGEFIVTVLPINNSFDADNVSYLWKNSEGNVVGMNSSELNISEIMNDATVFPATYEVTVSNSQGCSVTSNVIVYGAFCKIPKGISPNNDGKNEYFDLTGLGVDEIYIYNRYGTEVYHKKNYTKEWNGISDKGDELPAGTYFYMIQKNNNEKITGWVFIIR